MKKILFINFGVPKEESARTKLQAAIMSQMSVFVPGTGLKGLDWKIWLSNQQANTAGGVYLFDDQASVDAYLSSPLLAGMKANPLVSNLEIKVFDILVEPTKASLGPVF